MLEFPVIFFIVWGFATWQIALKVVLTYAVVMLFLVAAFNGSRKV